MAFLPGGGMARGPTSASIWATFAILLYLSLVKTNAKLKVAVALVYIAGWVVYFVQGDTVSAVTMVIHLVVTVYCFGHLIFSAGEDYW